MSLFVGIDPGLDGAIAFLNHDATELKVYDMPTLITGTTGKRTVDANALVNLFEKHCIIRHIFVELVAARPGQGVVSMFNFGVSCGVVKGVVAATKNPLTMVTPAKWKKLMGVPAAKDGAIARATQLMPRHTSNWTRKKDDGRAEAALLALYGLSTYDKSIINKEIKNVRTKSTLDDLLS